MTLREEQEELVLCPKNTVQEEGTSKGLEDVLVSFL